MKDKYDNFIRETTFKGMTHHREHTGQGKGWYEETKEYYPNLYAKNMWLDYDYIPEIPKEDTYSVKIGSEDVIIYKKYEYLELQPTNDKNIFYNKDFIHIIDKPFYHVVLYDSNKNEIPFGLRKWSYDGNNGLLTFIEGIPENIILPLYVTFYKYEGRMLDNGILRRDGGVKMFSDYLPEETDSNAIANVKYVNSKIKVSDEIIEKLTPPEPPSLENMPLILSTEKILSANRVLDGKSISPIAFEAEQVTIKTPNFYNPGKGLLMLLITSAKSSLSIPIIDMSKLEDSGNFKILYNDDYYLNDLNSSGFYKGISVGFQGSLKSIFMDGLPEVTFQIKEVFEDHEVYSQKFTIGKELTPSKNTLDNSQYLFLNKGEEFNWRRVSGIVTPIIGSKVNYSNLFTNTLKSYFIPGQKFISEKFFGDTTEEGYYEELPKLDGYGTVIADQKYPIKGVFEIPKGIYSENLNIIIKTYNILNEENGNWEKDYPFRIDTISDESQRVFSKSIKSYSELSPWDSNLDISELPELQLLGGKWVWPSLDFSKNGVTNYLTNWNSKWILEEKNPNYSKVKAFDTRYVTLKYPINYVNGVFIKIPGLSRIDSHHSFDIKSFELKIKNESLDTGWLDGIKAYDGIGNPKEGEGAFVASSSTEDELYFTFGYTPKKGTLYLRIGISNTQVAFDTPSIRENI